MTERSMISQVFSGRFAGFFRSIVALPLSVLGRAALALGTALLASCAQLGPSSLSDGRPAYNMAAARTNDQELLLNLVRLRYSDTTYFTQVERIAASVEYNRGLSAEGSFTGTTTTAPSGVTSLLSRFFRLGPVSMVVNEKPSVIYAPLEGEKFVRQMMTPMNPELLFLLVKSGWGVDRMLRVGAQALGSLRNVSGSYGAKDRIFESGHEFREAAALLHQLSQDHMVEIAKESEDPKGNVEVRFIGDGGFSPQAQRLRSLLGLSPDLDRFNLVGGGNSYDPKNIRLLTRSVLAAMRYLSEGVDVPEADLAAGKVRKAQRADGGNFDWVESLVGVFRVHVAAEPPADASVAITYRGNYFYIADNDIDSKATFLLLTQLIALHASPASASSSINLSIGR